jgi:SAM-dependent methyltransferase
LSSYSYSPSFLRKYRDESARSAAVVVPHVLQLLAPRGVVDVGCGLGTWQRAFQEHGIQQILGIDGEYLSPDLMLIAQESFFAHDLREPLELPASVPGRFDLAVCLEVAQHLPAAVAPRFVADLTRLAPAVLFSSAVPYQGGFRHVNEQWPDYWAQLFAQHDYATVDALRPLIWDDDRVAYYYAQNALLFVAADRLQAQPALQRFVVPAGGGPLAKVHPRRWLEANDPRNLGLRRILAALPFAVANAVAVRIGRR